MFSKIFKRFKRLFEKKESPKEQVKIIDILLYAKRLYMFHIKDSYMEDPGMCYCIYKAILYYTNTRVSYSDLTYYIPEFNAKFLNGNPFQVYWWPITDTESRIKAFDKLIKIYK
jgi:hypothetical protein